MAAGDRIAVRADDHAAALADQAAARVIRIQLEHRRHTTFVYFIRCQLCRCCNRDRAAQAGVGHTGNDGRRLAAAYRAGRHKAARAVRTGQYARAVQQTDRIRVGRGHGYIRDGAVRHRVDRRQGILRQRRSQHRREYRARSGLGVIRPRSGQDAVLQRVINIGLIPRLAFRKIRTAGIVNAVQAGGQLDRLGHGQRAVRRKARVRLAVDQPILIRSAHIVRIPRISRHIGKLAGRVSRLRGEVFIACQRRRQRAEQHRHRQQQAANPFFHWYSLRFRPSSGLSPVYTQQLVGLVNKL